MDITIRPIGAAISTEVDLNDEATFYFDWDSQWGEAQQPEPEEQQTQTTPVTTYPHPESWKRRELKLMGLIECKGHNDKRYQMSVLTSLFQGKKTIRRHGWELDVTFQAPREMQETYATPLAIKYEVTGTATPPFWRMAQTLEAIAYDTLLYSDYGIPYGEAQPPYDFYVTAPEPGVVPAGVITASPGAGSHLTIANWGTAMVYPEISLSGFPNSTAVYIKGPGRFRVKTTTSETGIATITATDRLYLAPGNNAIRFEDSGGTAIALGSSARANFGDTTLRNL